MHVLFVQYKFIYWTTAGSALVDQTEAKADWQTAFLGWAKASSTYTQQVPMPSSVDRLCVAAPVCHCVLICGGRTCILIGGGVLTLLLLYTAQVTGADGYFTGTTLGDSRTPVGWGGSP